jgi:hypothetical protein
MNWLYNNEEVESINDLPEGAYGFIYRILNPDGKFYIGKKSLIHNVKKALTKKELAEQSGPGRKATKKVVQKESDWKTYYGSADGLKEDLEKIGKENFTREIIKICYNKKELTYWEIAIQCKEDVLTSNSYNSNILGKFFRKDFLK